MIHNHVSALNSDVYLTYAIGCEYYNRLDRDTEFAIVACLLGAMGVEETRWEGARKAYSACCIHVAEAVQGGKELQDSWNSELPWFDFAFGLTIAEGRVLHDLAIHVHHVLAKEDTFEDIGDGANAAFTYQNNNTGRVFAWIHANSCSERANCSL